MIPREKERDQSDVDQSASDGDQSAGDVDQTLSDSDRSSSERDQQASNQDQQAAEIDQASSDETRGGVDDGGRYEQTREMRADSRSERDLSTQARGHASLSRDAVAARRDEVAQARDLVSAARDELASTLDAEIERLEGEHLVDASLDGSPVSNRAHEERLAAASSRARAASQRAAAAEDRARAARDRELAAADRLAYRKELEAAEMDEVTGALRRRVGLAALKREMDRTWRTKELLTVVFIDVDGLKLVNDHQGHGAGDDLLRAVVECVSKEFRSYDLIVRFGGDEFVSSITGDGLEAIEKRLDQVKACLGEAMAGASISTGVAQRRPEDTVETLIERADSAMIAARRRHVIAPGRCR